MPTIEITKTNKAIVISPFLLLLAIVPKMNAKRGESANIYFVI